MKLKVRCPHCAKLYEVESEDILSDTPVFQCISCDSHFGFEYPPANPEQVAAFLISTKSVDAPTPALQASVSHGAGGDLLKMQAELFNKAVEPSADTEMKSCPKCGALNGRRALECYSCHVIFERLEGLPQDTSLRAQPSLVRKWKNLLENFENSDLHDEFIRSCHELDALRFASMKYEELKTAQGGDALCDQMIAKINSLMMVGLAQKPTASSQANKHARPKWFKWLFWGPYTTAALMILWGMLSLGHRNLIGVGMALLCMTTGVIYMVRGRVSLSDFMD